MVQIIEINTYPIIVMYIILNALSCMRFNSVMQKHCVCKQFPYNNAMYVVGEPSKKRKKSSLPQQDSLPEPDSLPQQAIDLQKAANKYSIQILEQLKTMNENLVNLTTAVLDRYVYKSFVT